MSSNKGVLMYRDEDVKCKKGVVMVNWASLCSGVTCLELLPHTWLVKGKTLSRSRLMKRDNSQRTRDDTKDTNGVDHTVCVLLKDDDGHAPPSRDPCVSYQTPRPRPLPP